MWIIFEGFFDVRQNPAGAPLLFNMTTQAFGLSLFFSPLLYSSFPPLFFPLPSYPLPQTPHNLLFQLSLPLDVPLGAESLHKALDTQSEGEKGSEKRKGARERRRENRGWEVAEGDGKEKKEKRVSAERE